MRTNPESKFKSWRECEAEFRATRDKAMRITLPRLKCLEKPLDDKDADRRAA